MSRSRPFDTYVVDSCAEWAPWEEVYVSSSESRHPTTGILILNEAYPDWVITHYPPDPAAKAACMLGWAGATWPPEDPEPPYQRSPIRQGPWAP